MFLYKVLPRSYRIPTARTSALFSCSYRRASTHCDDDAYPGHIVTTPPHCDDDAYPGHIVTTPLQKCLLAVGSSVMCITAPWRGDMIATMGEVTGGLALPYMKKNMLTDEVGRQILKEKPRINSKTIDLEGLRTLPEGTFGRAYRKMLDDYDLTPDARPAVQFVDDPDLAYVMQRYREVHDLIHTLLGMPTNMLGEIVVKWVEGIQFGLPLGLTGGLLGPLRLGPKHMERYLNEHLWWALTTGRNADFLLNVYFEKHWDVPIEDLRQRYNITPPPYTPVKKTWMKQS